MREEAADAPLVLSQAWSDPRRPNPALLWRELTALTVLPSKSGTLLHIIVSKSLSPGLGTHCRTRSKRMADHGAGPRMNPSKGQGRS